MIRKSFYTIPFLLFIVLLAVTATAILNRPLVTDQNRLPEESEPLPAFALEGLSSADIKGPALVNFFASWCIPCEAEHSVITELAGDIPVYGIAFMDKPEDLNAFLKRLGNPYQAIGRDRDGVTGADWGIRGVPTSFVINENNYIVYRHDAPLTPADVARIRKLLEAPE